MYSLLSFAKNMLSNSAEPTDMQQNWLHQKNLIARSLFFHETALGYFLSYIFLQDSRVKDGDVDYREDDQVIWQITPRSSP